MAIEKLSLVGGGPEDIRKKLVLDMMQQGMSGAPVQHWTQGMDRVAKALIGGLEMRDIERRDDEEWGKLKDALKGYNQPPTAAAAADPPAAPPRPRPSVAPVAGVPSPSAPGPMGAMPSVDPPYGDPPPAPAMTPEQAQAAKARDPNNPMNWGAYSVEDERGNVVATGDQPPASPSVATGATTPPRPTAPMNQVAQAPRPTATDARPAPNTMPPQPSPADPRKQQLIDTLLNSRNPAMRAMGVQMSTQGSKWEKLNEDTLYEQSSGRTMPVNQGFKPLTDPAERASFGIPPDDKRPYQISPSGRLINPPAETRVNIDQRNETEFGKGAARVQTERFGKIIEAGTQAQDTVANISALRDIGTRITTGKAAEITAALGPWAELAGVKIENLDDMQAFKSIVAKIAPQMRVPGSGATSDFEMRQFLESLPTLGKTPGGNEIISRTLEAVAEHRIAAAEIASRALAQEINPRQAEKELRELPNPLELWKQNRPGQSPTSSGGSGVRRYNPETGRIE